MYQKTSYYQIYIAFSQTNVTTESIHALFSDVCIKHRTNSLNKRFVQCAFRRNFL